MRLYSSCATTGPLKEARPNCRSVKARVHTSSTSFLFMCVYTYVRTKEGALSFIKSLLIVRTCQISAEASYSMVKSSLAWISTILNSVLTKERLREAYLPCDLRDLPGSGAGSAV